MARKIRLHETPPFGPRNPQSNTIEKQSTKWAAEVLGTLQKESPKDIAHHFESNGIVARALTDLALHAGRAVAHDPDTGYRTKRKRQLPLNVDPTLEKNWTWSWSRQDKSRIHALMLEHLRGKAPTKNPRPIAPGTLFDCIREEMNEGKPGAPTVSLDDTNILESEAVKVNPASLFDLLFSRHEHRGIIAAKRAEITPESARKMPEKFLEQEYEMDGKRYGIFDMNTATNLIIAGALGAHCVGDGGWSRQIMPGKDGKPKAVILSVSEILGEPQSLTALNPSSERVQALVQAHGVLKAPHHTLVTIECQIMNNAVYIGQVKMRDDELIGPGDPASRLLLESGVLSDIHAELVKRYGRVSGFGSDLRRLKKPGHHLTVAGKYIPTEELRGDEVVVAGDTITLLPTVSAEMLAKYCNLSNVTLDFTALFELMASGSHEKREQVLKLCAPITRIRGTMRTTSSAPLVLSSDIFPNLTEMGGLVADDVQSLRLDLPALAKKGGLHAGNAESLTLNLPALVESGGLYAGNATNLTFNLPALVELDVLDAENAESLTFNSPVLAKIGDLYAGEVESLTLDLPALAELGGLYAENATSLTLNLPALVETGEVTAPEVRNISVCDTEFLRNLALVSTPRATLRIIRPEDA